MDQSQALHALLPYPTRVHLKFQKRSKVDLLSVWIVALLCWPPTPVNLYDHPRRNPWKIRLLYFESYSRYLMWISGKIYMNILPKILDVWGQLGSRRSMFTFLMVPSHIRLFWTIDNNFSFFSSLFGVDCWPPTRVIFTGSWGEIYGKLDFKPCRL